MLLLDLFSYFKQISRRYHKEDRDYHLILEENGKGKIAIIDLKTNSYIKNFMEWETIEEGENKLRELCSKYYWITLTSNNHSLNKLNLQPSYLLEVSAFNQGKLQNLLLNYFQKQYPTAKITDNNTSSFEFRLDQTNRITVRSLEIAYHQYKNLSEFYATVPRDFDGKTVII